MHWYSYCKIIKGNYNEMKIRNPIFLFFFKIEIFSFLVRIPTAPLCDLFRRICTIYTDLAIKEWTTVMRYKVPKILWPTVSIDRTQYLQNINKTTRLIISVSISHCNVISLTSLVLRKYWKRSSIFYVTLLICLRENFVFKENQWYNVCVPFQLYSLWSY